MLKGVKVKQLKSVPDERGFFAEIFRSDWKSFISTDNIVQVNLSMSHPETVRAWHRHSRGQVDYICVLKGKARICIYDDTKGSKTRGQLNEIILDGKKPSIVRIPGFYWHGTKCIGKELSLTLYLMTRLYDYKNPDEERRAWNDSSVKKGNKPYDWKK
jgi:dTDP-4-dehydrorhamnose 3,5-epimerase